MNIWNLKQYNINTAIQNDTGERKDYGPVQLLGNSSPLRGSQIMLLFT
jgi:hypothetical protein